MICTECGAVFEPSEAGAKYDNVPVGDHMESELVGYCCPECGSYEIEEEAYCRECGTVIPKTLSELNEGLCQECADDLQKALEAFWRELGDAQKDYALTYIDSWMTDTAKTR